MAYDLSDYLAPGGTQAYMLDNGSGSELCQSVRQPSGYTRFLKNQHYETLWVDNLFVYRGLDTSGLPGEVYALFTGDRYGSAWAKRFVSVGVVFERVADVRHYDANGTLLRTDAHVVTYLKLAQHFTVLTIQETGQSVADVLLFEQAFDAGMATVYERYYFAKGLGLVKFDFTGSPPFHSRFSGFTQVKPVFVPMPNFSEPVPPPIEKVSPPMPTPLIPLGQFTLTAVPGSYINVRDQPATTGRDIGDLHPGDVVTLYSPDALGWVHLTTPTFEGWVSRQDGKVQFTPLPPVKPALASIIDVSEAQGIIDWQKVKAAGVQTVIIRASQGTAQVDTRFHLNINGALLAGLEIGVYHALIASSDGAQQAAHFLKTIEAFRADLGLPLVIDVELQNGRTPTQIADTLYAMADALAKATGVLPMIYTTAGFFNGQVGSQHDAYFADLPLWVANWRTSGNPVLPRCWQHYAYWQYSSTGKVDGIQGRVDLSRKR